MTLPSLSTLSAAAQSILPLFKKGGRLGAWRLYLVAAGVLISTMQGQSMLEQAGLPPTWVAWLAMKAAQIMVAGAFITMVKDHVKQANAGQL